jgi:hypothetical protein
MSPITRPMDLPAAEKAIRQGSDLGFFVAIVSLLGGILATTTNSSGFLEQWNDPWIFVAGVLFAGLALGVRRRSRTCAIGLTAFYVVSMISQYIMTGRASCFVVPGILTFFFAKSIEGTFVYHKLRGEEEPEYRAVAKWAYWLLIPASAVFLLFISLIVVGSVALPSAVIAGDEMKPRHKELLRERGVLFEDEQVVMFYSAAFFSILGDGNLLTDRRVVSYGTIDEELFIAGAAYEDILGVTVLSEGSSFEDTTIEIKTASGESFIVLASAEAGGDKRFLADLESRLGQPQDAPALE